MGAWSVICKYYPHSTQLCIILNTWILTTKTIIVLAAFRDVASGSDGHLDVTFGLQVFESSSLVSVFFREVFNHPYISVFHLLVNVFFATSFRTFSTTHSLPYIGGW